MKIKGHEITDAQIDIVILRMKMRPFTREQIVNTCLMANVPGYLCAPTAWRIIQRESKASRIRWAGGRQKWQWIAP